MTGSETGRTEPGRIGMGKEELNNYGEISYLGALQRLHAEA